MRIRILLTVSIALAAGLGVEMAMAELRVGVAVETINPAEGTYLCGYGHNRKSTGVHDDLYAKAIVFDDGKQAVALLVCDATSLQYPTVKAIRAAAAEKLADSRLKSEHILPQATHTHAAPDTIGIYGPNIMTTGVSPDYMALLVEKSAAAVLAALEKMQPVSLVWAQSECRGWAVNDSEPEILDNSVTILQCLDAEGRSVATLTNFACHPTVLDGNNTLVSSDWVYGFYKKMSEALPGEHLYLQGAIGAWIQPKTPERSFALAEQYGVDLAEKTLEALKQAKPVEGTQVQAATRVFGMPIENALFRGMFEIGLIDRGPLVDDSAETEVGWFALGKAQFATHPGETAPEFTFQTRDLMNSEPKFVLGLGLDHLGYICPVRWFDDPESIPFAKYQVSMSPGREAGPKMIAMLAEIIPGAEKGQE
jgi:hypothetical protein